MAQIGKYNRLKVVKELDFGLYLFDAEHGEILLPKRYVPENAKIDDELDVFIYLDSEDRIIATTEQPFAQVGEFACLKVVSTSDFGAFLDWGLSKDLLVPFRKQKKEMEIGKSYVVYIYYDYESKRIVASSKLDYFLDNVPAEYTEGEKVNLLIVTETPMGYKAIINGLHWGVLYKNEVFTTLQPGYKIEGYIKKLRTDDKIDLCLQKPGYQKITDIPDRILEKIKENNGFLAITDKTLPDTIYNMFGISKKAYKAAVGALYKKQLIVIEPTGIRINVDGEE